jgi:hypothetical protein
MKKLLLILIVLILPFLSVNSQTTGGGSFSKPEKKTKSSEKFNSLSVKSSTFHLSLIEYERLLPNKIGLSAGVVPVGINFSGKYHYSENIINSPSVGLKTGFSYSPLREYSSIQFGALYEYRTKKLFVASADLGFHRYTYTDDGDYYDSASYFGLYINLCVGIYFPW